MPLTFEDFWNVIHPNRLTSGVEPVPEDPPTLPQEDPGQGWIRERAESSIVFLQNTPEPKNTDPLWEAYLESKATLGLYIARSLLGEDSTQVETQAFDLMLLPSGALIRTYRRLYP
jgi:hypothetical protein